MDQITDDVAIRRVRVEIMSDIDKFYTDQMFGKVAGRG